MNSETSLLAPYRDQNIIYKILDLNSLTMYQRTLHTNKNIPESILVTELLKQEYFRRLYGNAF